MSARGYWSRPGSAGPPPRAEDVARLAALMQAAQVQDADMQMALREFGESGLRRFLAEVGGLTNVADIDALTAYAMQQFRKEGGNG